mmetsp:Transcript_6910/g.22420  ORF Transcript_6910/g.22420 Transcript_6910/m.22420 type:complete len:203 (-) Transcript_6910:195-803(-)
MRRFGRRPRVRQGRDGKVEPRVGVAGRRPRGAVLEADDPGIASPPGVRLLRARAGPRELGRRVPRAAKPREKKRRPLRQKPEKNPQTPPPKAQGPEKKARGGGLLRRARHGRRRAYDGARVVRPRARRRLVEARGVGVLLPLRPRRPQQAPRPAPLPQQVARRPTRRSRTRRRRRRPPLRHPRRSPRLRRHLRRLPRHPRPS